MSIENGQGQDFLREKYKLQSSPEVESAVNKSEQQTGEEVSDDPNTRIQIYLDRLQNIINPPILAGHENFDRQERNIEILKNMLHRRFVIQKEEIPEGYFQNIIKRHEEEGRPIEEIPEDIRSELAETLIKDQTNSLDLWVDYLTSTDAKYPDWLKYWAFRNVLVMGRYDKEKKKFTERSKSGKSVSPFPDLNRDALAYVFDAMEKKRSGESINFPYDIQSEEQNEFKSFLDRGSFTHLYAWTVEKINPISEEMLEKTEGEWRTFPKGSDHLSLANSLANYGTGWCIRGESTAKRYLNENDLEIYYSLDENNEPKIPRIVIVSDDNGRISEVRGVAEQENLDPYIGEVAKEKLDTLPDGKSYEKRFANMKQLTAINNKIKAGQGLGKDDLIFLYEINSKIEGFGYQRDPRIEELRSHRDPKLDAPIVFQCQPEEIAFSQNEINQTTKAYIGSLFTGIFTKLANMEHVYTAFPEGKINRYNNIEIGGKDKEQLKKEIKEKRKIYPGAEYMMDSNDFTTAEGPENINLVRLSVKDLGFPNGATTDEIYQAAGKFGLELCPAEVGPQLRLQDTEQPLDDYYWIAMKQITDRHGYPCFFYLDHLVAGLGLDSYYANPSFQWTHDSQFVFRLRKVSQET